MTLLRVVSAGIVFAGVSVGILQFEQTAVFGVALIGIGLLSMFTISLLDRQPAPSQRAASIPPEPAPDQQKSN